MRRSGEDERWREGAAGRKVWNESQKEWLDITVQDPQSCRTNPRRKSTFYKI